MSAPIPDVEVQIQEPLDQSQIPANYIVTLRATAAAGSKDLGSKIRWRSDIDGFLGKGAELAVSLSPGTHRIRAKVRGPKRDLAKSSEAGGSSQEGEDGGSDDVTVSAVPLDYSGGDT